MCTIAGYAGERRAAPILVEMIRRQQFLNGGLSTGIATVHEGKLYYAKVTGDLDVLLNTTDALDLPGNVGIIHSRTSGNYLSHAHPFLSDDKNAAFVLNGTFNTASCPEFVTAYSEAMNDLYRRGLHIDSAVETEKPMCGFTLPDGRGFHLSEFYALTVGEAVKNSENEVLARDMADAFRRVLEDFPADIVMVGVHARLDRTVTVGAVTRPMNCVVGEGEAYLATSAMGFPEELRSHPIIPIPPTTVAQITPDGFKICSSTLDGTRVEQIDYRIASYIREKMEKLLTEKEMGIPDMPVCTEWREVWSDPMMDCKYSVSGGMLKPYATVLYECLWSFYKEGRLHSRLGIDHRGRPTLMFWLDKK